MSRLKTVICTHCACTDAEILAQIEVTGRTFLDIKRKKPRHCDSVRFSCNLRSAIKTLIAVYGNC